MIKTLLLASLNFTFAFAGTKVTRLIKQILVDGRTVKVAAELSNGDPIEVKEKSRLPMEHV